MLGTLLASKVIIIQTNKIPNNNNNNKNCFKDQVYL